jgi:hypothetical protein
MEHSLFLRQYKYEIPGSPSAFTAFPIKDNAGQAIHQPEFLAFFDFESGDFQIEGFSHSIITANQRYKNSWLTQQNTRVFIDADMKPEIPAGPNDNLGNELLLYINGSIYNGQRRVRCSGLLRLNRSSHNNNAQWMIYCNLVDDDMNAFEIKLRLPVFTNVVKAPGDN